MADRFWTLAFAYGRIEPPARVESARLAGQRESPFPELRFEKILVEPCQIAHLANAHRVQRLFSHLADPRDLPHIERGQKLRFKPGHHPENSVRFRLI